MVNGEPTSSFTIHRLPFTIYNFSKEERKMMDIRIFFVVLFSLLAAACTGSSSATYDLSTDEGVRLAYVQEKGGGSWSKTFVWNGRRPCKIPS
jgi:hypothetical protein